MKGDPVLTTQAKCSEARCTVDALVAAVKEQYRLRPRALFDVRSTQDVARSGHASASERAVVLLQALSAAKIDARLAFASSNLSGQFDPNFPSTTALDTPLLWVPSLQRFIEPGCDGCGPGQVREELRGQTAVVLELVPWTLTDRVADFELKRINAAASSPQLRRASHQVTIAVDGALADAYRIDHFNDADVAVLQHTKSAAWLKNRANSAVVARSSAAHLDSFGSLTCDSSSHCSETRNFSVRDAAVVDGSLLMVPLFMLDPGFESTFAKAPRKEPVHRRARFIEEESVSITVPAGYRLVGQGTTASVKGTLVDSSLSIAPTPTGATVTRMVELKPGAVSVDEYPTLRDPHRFVAESRSRVLVFERK